MLIASGRHKPADLELWAELESADRLNGERLLKSGKAERSIEAIREFVAAGPCYLSVSWGKDSVALASLAIESGFVGPLVHLKAVPVGNPETHAVRDAFLGRYKGADYRETVVDYRDIPKGLGSDKIEREKDQRFFRAFPGGRYLSGIRADESSGRKIRMRKWGLSGPTTCAPLGWWTATDVFGYLTVNHLPVHPAYAMLGDGRWERKHLRVDELAGDRGDQFGRREWELEYYGDVLRRIDAANF